MALATGTRLGPYEILGTLGAGGMGEVYKARDARLDRTVAIKVLPAAVASDEERRLRFDREARTIASLNHPHICAIYDVGREGDTDFLVMEHVAGETLGARLQKGALPLEQALVVATEIADAIAVAHRAGVVHRDLKPGNVMLTKSGAKLLDFGLAKLRPVFTGPSLAATVLPTAEPMTEKGLVLGTVPYMAPEQIEGREADPRSDIFSFGAVVYEMLTGKRAFDGSSQASVIAAILEHDPPPPSALQPLTPPCVDRLVRQCLAKSPDDRPDTAHDVANELRRMRETSGTVTPAERSRAKQVRAALLVTAAIAIAGVSAGTGWRLHPVAPVLPAMHLTLDVRPAEELARDWHTALAWTRDGQALVFVGLRSGVRQLYVRRLDSPEARPLAGTEGALVPAVSPDGQWVAFWANGTIRKVPLGGGLVVDVAPVPGVPSGLAWDDQGRLFGGGAWMGIGMLPTEGSLRFVTTIHGAESHHSPSVLPGGRGLLYTQRTRELSWGDEEIVAQVPGDPTRKVLLRNATDARYVGTGHLVFLRLGKLFAVPFDADRGEVRGREVALLDGIAQALTEESSAGLTGAGQYAVSPTGTLAWVSRPVVPYRDAALVSVDRTGRVTSLATPAKSYGGSVRVSPDGRRLAVSILSFKEAGLWVFDFDRGILAPVNQDGESMSPEWAPNGRDVVFEWLKDGAHHLATQPADGSAAPTPLVDGAFVPSSFTPDGRQVIVLRGSDVAVVTIEARKATLQPVLRTSTTATGGQLSPDGKWLLYGSDLSGRDEIYVRPYGGQGRETPTRVSIDGGGSPAWHPNGHEIFFVSAAQASGRRRMMVAQFSPGSPLPRPRALFEYDPRELVFGCVPVRCYDVAPDGQSFYALQPRPSSTPSPTTHINLILNWFEDLKAKVPVK